MNTFPLRKRILTSFCSFEPTGKPLGANDSKWLDDLDDFYPPYLLRGSPEESQWKLQNPYGWHKKAPAAPIQHAPAGHNAAATGDIARLKKIAKADKEALVYRDTNGWEPVHKAVRSGSLEAVKFLVKNGADINSRTGRDKRGETPLALALQYLEFGDELTKWLIDNGGVHTEEEL